MMNREIIENGIIKVHDLFQNMKANDAEKLIVIANCLLDLSLDYFPPELEDVKESLINSGVQLSLESATYMTNIGLQMAIKGHLLIDMAHEITKV